MTLVQEEPEPRFGETNILFDLRDFYFEGMVINEMGLADVTGGGVEKAFIGGKEIILTSKEFSEGALHTEEFGKIRMLTNANMFNQCVLLVATPEQVSMIMEWLQ